MLANHVRINNEIKKDNIYITDERKEEFEEFWKTYADNPLQGKSIASSIRNYYFFFSFSSSFSIHFSKFLFSFISEI
jgi:hypothetical protein